VTRRRPASQSLGRHEGGAVLALFAIAMVAMLGLVGLALDGGHGMLNKTRLQNVVDAAALSAAKTLDISGGDVVMAEIQARNAFSGNATLPGHQEIANAYNGGALTVAVEFSATLDPFVPGTAPAEYVRVRATGLNLPGWFIPVLGIAEKRVGASAVAGPSPTLGEACNVAPMMACGTNEDPDDEFYGYDPGQVTVLKTSAGGGEFDVGPGNFQLIRMDGNTGAADLRESLAGSFNSCVSTNGETVPTEPGNTVGPVAQGLNTRLGIYTGPMLGKEDQYPPDKVLDQITPFTEQDGVVYYNGQPNPQPEDLPFSYEDYLAHIHNPGFWNEYAADGLELRRVLRMPVGDCDGTVNGQGDVPVMGVLCFFLLQQVVQKGNEADVFGQFMGADSACPVTGKPGPEPVAGPGPYIIQLYKDPDGNAS
jgi:hypothetical protein